MEAGSSARPTFAGRRFSWFANTGIQAGVAFIIALLLYCNTFTHEYALDDRIVILGNEFVHEGVAGLHGIFGNDTYFSYYDRLHTDNQLAGGRYRPLSVATFALEQQVFGVVPPGGVDSLLEFGVGYKAEAPYEERFFHEMHTRHVVNVLLFALSAVLLLFFFRLIVFRSNPTAAFVATILFVAHPVHTEVVANVKSRDEIMSLLFICLTFVASHFYFRTRRAAWLAAALASYLLALLSKEYGVTLLLLLPLTWYVCYGHSVKRAAKDALPFVAVFLIYAAMRWHAVGFGGGGMVDDIQVNPYAYATPIQKAATVISTSLRYIRLLVFPYPLSADYSYNQLPYTSFSDPVVWLSCMVHLGLFSGLIYFTRRRSLWAVAIGWYLLNLLLVNNFVFDIGATMGERLIYHSSVGFVIAIVLAAAQWVQHDARRSLIAGAAATGVILMWGFLTIDRNTYWKNDATLFMKDIEVCPNSFLVNENVGGMLVNMSDYEPDNAVRVANVRRAVGLFSHVLEMKDDYVLGYLNRGIAYLKLGMADSMLADLDKVKQLYPIHPSLPQLYYHAAILCREKGDIERAAAILHTAADLAPRDVALRNIVNKADAEADSLRAAGSR